MDKIPLQTLKRKDIVPVEDQINEISIKCASVRRNFKPTVRSRREFEPDDRVDFDSEFEKELCKVNRDVDDVYLKETLPKIEAELNLWTHEYKNLLDAYSKLHEDNVKDQILLKESDDQIQAKLSRVHIVENIKSSLLTEVRKLCLHLERIKSDSDKKLERTTTNFKDIIRYLNRGFEAERVTHAETTEILRKLEHSLRGAINKCEDEKAKNGVLHDELKRTKIELHHCQHDLSEQEKNAKTTSLKIRKLELELQEAQDRAELAEQTLSRHNNRR